MRANVFSIAISPDGGLIAAGYHDSIVHLWDVQTGQLINCLVGYINCVSSVAFTPDGKGLVSGSKDQTMKHCDLEPLLRNMPRKELGQPCEVGVKDTDLVLKEKGGHNEEVLCVCVRATLSALPPFGTLPLSFAIFRCRFAPEWLWSELSPTPSPLSLF
jgi:general transcriptional corepressor TUP1